MLKRLAAGMTLSAAILFVAMAGQILAVPLYLSTWGAEIYGEWLTLTNLVTGISILNLGVQSHVSNRLIAYYVRGNLAEGARMLHAALRLYIAACGAALLVVLALCLWPGLPAWIGVKALGSKDARLILALQGCLSVYAILGGLLLSLFRVTNQLPRQLGYSLIERILFIGAPCCAALLGSGPAGATCVVAAMVALLAAIELRDVNRRTPFPIGISQSTWRSSRALIAPSFAFLAVSLSSQLLTTGMVLIVSVYSGAIAVAVFTTTLMLTNFVRTIVNQGMNVMWPEITSAAALGSRASLLRWRRSIDRLAFALAAAGAAGIALFGPRALALWTRGRITPDPALNLILSVYLLIHAPALVNGVFGLALERQMSVFKIQLLTAASSILLALFATPRWGVSGAAGALALGQLAGSFLMRRSVSDWIDAAAPPLELCTPLPILTRRLS